MHPYRTANSENNGLLGSDWEELNDYPNRTSSHSPSIRSEDEHAKDQSGSGTRTPKTPRTPMKVRFDIPGGDDDDSRAEAGYMSERDRSGGRAGAIRDADGVDDGDLHPDDEESHSAPLLPSATTPIDAALENPLDRPTSSLHAAISNMSNSILGAGIIGQPYALK